MSDSSRTSVSMYSFDDPKASERRETQYFEMFGNRGIYHKGWTAVTRHKTPWLLVGEKTPPFYDDVWELYDTNNVGRRPTTCPSSFRKSFTTCSAFG